MITLTSEQEKICQDALTLIGKKRIWNAVQEESAELVQAVAKLRRPLSSKPEKNEARIDNLYEEMCDAYMSIVNASMYLDQDRLKAKMEEKFKKYNDAVLDGGRTFKISDFFED